MDINGAFPSKYLKASDIAAAQPVVQIDRVVVEQVGREQEHKPVVYFVGKSKGVVLNKTNARAIAQIAGSSETDDWAGTSVQLYVAQVEFSGESMEAIRIRAPRAAQPKRQPTPPTPPPPPAAEDADDCPF